MMVILMIVLMVTMAISFMSMVGRQRGSALVIAAQTKADIAIQQAQNHVIKTMVESAADPSLTYHNMHNPSWRTEFSAVTDPDGDPFTSDGVGKPAGTRKTTGASTSRVFEHELVNSRKNLFDMTGNKSGRYYTNMFTFGVNLDRWSGSSFAYISRWYNVEYLDDHFRHIHIDESLSEADKADLRKNARYVVRYMAQVMDLNGMQCINNNYPDAPIPPGTGSVNDDEYVRYQNYLRVYGRSIKSQTSCFLATDGFGLQRRSNDPDFASVDPLDREVCNMYVEGSYKRTPYSGLGFSLANDARLRAEHAFRGDLQWADEISVSGIARMDMYGALHKSRVYSWGQINQIFIGEDLRYPWNSHPDVASFAPYGDSLNDFSSEYTVPTPWYVNLLTCPNNVFAHMIMGLHSHLHYTRNDNAINGRGDRGAQADLFGRGYPESFPLALDSGKDVPLVGEGYIDSKGDHIVVEDGEFFEGFPAFKNSGGKAVMTSSIAGQRGIRASPGYENSYMMDIAMAFNLALRNVRRVWVEGNSLDSGAEQSYPLGSPLVFKYKNGVNNSYIDASVTDPDQMLNLVIREVYRVLGEGYIDTGFVPAVSKNFYNHANPGLLAGGVNNVGLGSLRFHERQAQLPSTANTRASTTNTRAMEYALNDVMISLFGKANPAFDIGDPRDASDNPDPLSEAIAIDFNNDGIAESTVTGWKDPESPAGTIQRIWSFWFDGLGPYVNVDYEFMKEPGWYRFYENGSIWRKDGSRWVELTTDQSAAFRDYNSMWLTGNNVYPLKAHAKTGRFFIGKSKILQGFIRGEVYNLLNQSVMASSNRSFVYRVDPDDDGDYKDSHVLRQADFVMK